MLEAVNAPAVSIFVLSYVTSKLISSPVYVYSVVVATGLATCSNHLAYKIVSSVTVSVAKSHAFSNVPLSRYQPTK